MDSFSLPENLLPKAKLLTLQSVRDDVFLYRTSPELKLEEAGAAGAGAVQ